jgi:hypothetical protein
MSVACAFVAIVFAAAGAPDARGCALDRNRTCDLPLRRRSLYPLSYEGRLQSVKDRVSSRLRNPTLGTVVRPAQACCHYPVGLVLPKAFPGLQDTASHWRTDKSLAGDSPRVVFDGSADADGQGRSLLASVRNAASGSLAGASSTTSCCASRSVPRRQRRGHSPRNTCPGRVRTLRFQSRTGHPEVCAPCRGMVERSLRGPQLRPSRSQGADDEERAQLIVFGVRHLRAIP